MSLPNIAVVLVAPRNPLNIGAVARAMSNFGFADLRIAAAHAPNVDEARSAVDAAPLLATAGVFGTLAEAIADCQSIVGATTGKARNLQRTLHVLPDAAELFGKPGKTALLFGSEKHGLTADDLSYCDALLIIPTREQHLSMNLGQAAAICLYAVATSQNSRRATEGPARATSHERDLLLHSLLDALKDAGYAGADNSVVLEQKARRMVTNLSLTGDDARLLLGMLRRLAAQRR